MSQLRVVKKITKQFYWIKFECRLVITMILYSLKMPISFVSEIDNEQTCLLMAQGNYPTAKFLKYPEIKG